MDQNLSPAEAIKKLAEIVEILRAKNDPAHLQLALGSLGKEYLRNGDTLKGLTCFDEAVSLAQQVGDMQSEALHTGNQGYALAQIGNFDMALRALRRAQSLGRRVNQSSIVYDSLMAMASLEINRDNPDQAVDYLQEAPEIAQESGEARREFNAMTALAQAHWETGALEDAIRHYQAGLELSLRMSSPDDEMECCDRLAHLHHQAEDFAEESRVLQQAIQHHPAGAAGQPAGWHLRLGDACLELEDWPAAAAAYRRALTLAVEQAAPAAITRALGGLSVVASEQGNLNEAHQFAFQAVEASLESTDVELYAQQLIMLAFAQRDLGQVDEAAAAARQALQIFVQNENFSAEQRVRRFLEELTS